MSNNEKLENNNIRNLVKVNDLPFYKDEIKENNLKTENFVFLEENVSFIRKYLISNLVLVSQVYDQSKIKIKNFYSKSKDTYENLIDEKQKLNKTILITTSGLLGFILPFRKSYFKKLIYSGFFAATTSAACYPNQTKEYFYVTAYIVKNKWPPLIKEYANVDIQDAVDKSFKRLSEITILQPYLKTISPSNKKDEN